VDGVVLAGEISELELAGIPVLERLSIDSQATLLEQHHLVREQYAASSESTDLVTRIGSTGKGVGAARADRIMREAGIYGGPTDVGRMARDWVDTLSYPVIIEATQGYGLGLHAGFYPKCTSRDVRSIDVLAEVGISPWQPGVDRVITWVVFRPNPIRVAGDSGPLTAETSWEDLGLEPEFTTVTKKMRRVGGWNVDLALDAMAANGGPSPVVRPILMFADYIDRALRDVSDFDDFDNEALDALAAYNVGTPWYGYGTGPGSFAWVDDPYK
jgi:adenylosuccinate synthase